MGEVYCQGIGKGRFLCHGKVLEPTAETLNFVAVHVKIVEGL